MYPSSVTIAPLLMLGLASVASSLPLQHLMRRTAAGSLISQLLSGASGPVSVPSSDDATLNFPVAAGVANAAYCDNVRNGTWDCPSCQSSVSDMQLLFETGDGSDVQKAYVGYSSSLSTLFVAYEGTEKELDAWITDLTFDLANLNSSLDNGSANSSTQVHQGFQEAFFASSDDMLGAVKSALSGPASSASLVLVTGHSLGAALSVFMSIYLTLNLPSGTNIQQVGFGQPRVGNAAFSDYYSNLLGDNQMRTTNGNDPVPHLPPMSSGYEQFTNEFWIPTNSTSSLYLCPGVENDACADSVGDGNLLVGEGEHDGPYYGVKMDNC